MDHTALIDTATLADRLDDPRWVVIDCRHDLANPAAGEAGYRSSHVRGARFLHLDRDLSGPKSESGALEFGGRHPLPQRAVLASTLGRAGVDSSRQVVAYDAQGGMAAARLWWLLRWMGHARVAVLDGGWQAWTAAGHPVSSDVPPPSDARFIPADGIVPPPLRAAEVLSGLGQLTLLDARTAERHRGQNETLDPVGGRIPGARNRFFMSNLGLDGGFKPAATLRAEFEELLCGVPARSLVHYCGSGVSACHNLLAMAAAGLDGGRLYPGSWSEWCSDPSRPMAAGEQQPGETTSG